MKLYQSTKSREYECKVTVHGMYVELAELFMKARSQTVDEFVSSAIKEYVRTQLSNPEMLMEREFKYLERLLDSADEEEELQQNKRPARTAQ